MPVTSCQPNDLAAAAKCFYCLPNQTLSEVQTFLLASLAGQPENLTTLAAASKSFMRLPPSTLLEVQVYLLAVITKSSTDPSTLAQLAKCFECLNPNLLYQVETYLLAVKAGGTTDPNTLASLSRVFMSGSPVTLLEIQTYLLALLAGTSTDPNVLASLAKCFFCLPGIILRDVKTYLLCQYASSTGGWSIFTTPSLGSSPQTFNHGLPGTPQIVFSSFTNVTASAGFSVGDMIPDYLVSNQSFIFGPVPAWANATQVTGEFGATAGPQQLDKSVNGQLDVFSSANWQWNITCAFFGSGGIIPKVFTQGGITHDTGLVTFNHGLGKTPQVLMAFFDNVANDPGTQSNAGDVRPLWTAIDAANFFAICVVGANATQVFCNTQMFQNASLANAFFYLTRTNNNGAGPTSFDNFRLRIVAMAF